MPFWLNSNGKLLVGASGNPIDCAECPCPAGGPVDIEACGLPTFQFSRNLLLTVIGQVGFGAPGWPNGTMKILTFCGTQVSGSFTHYIWQTTDIPAACCDFLLYGFTFLNVGSGTVTADMRTANTECSIILDTSCSGTSGELTSSNMPTLDCNAFNPATWFPHFGRSRANAGLNGPCFGNPSGSTSGFDWTIEEA